MRKILYIIATISVYFSVCLFNPVSLFAEQVVKSSFDADRLIYSSTGAANFMISNPTHNYLYDENGDIISGYTRSYFTPGLKPNFKNDILLPNGNFYTFHQPIGNSTVDNRQYFTVFFNIDEGVVTQKSNGTVDRNCQTYFGYSVNDGRLFVQRFRRWVGTSQYCSNSNYAVQSTELNNTDGNFSTFTGDIPNLKTGTNITSDIYIISENSFIYMKSGDVDTIYQWTCNDFAVCEETPYIDLDLSASGGAINEFQYFYNDSGNIPFGGISLEIFDGSQTNVFTGYYVFDENGNFVDNPSFQEGFWVTRVFSDGEGGYNTYIVNPTIMQENQLIFNLDKNPLIAFVPIIDGYNFRYIRGGVLYDYDAVFDGYNYIGGDSEGETLITPGGSGEGGVGGTLAQSLGVDCNTTFGFLSPVCWLDSIGEGLQNIPGFNAFADRVTTYTQFLDFSLTPGPVDFTLKLPTGSNNLEMEEHQYTMPTSYTPNIVYFQESYDSTNPILNYITLIICILLYYFGVLVFLFSLVFGVGYAFYKIIIFIVNKLTFGVLGSSLDIKGDSTILGLIFMIVFFGILVAMFDIVFSPVASTLAETFTNFKEVYGHFWHFVAALITKGQVDLIFTVNLLNASITLGVLGLITYIAFTKYGRLF